jgi:hypothetical protein
MQRQVTGTRVGQQRLEGHTRVEPLLLPQSRFGHKRRSILIKHMPFCKVGGAPFSFTRLSSLIPCYPHSLLHIGSLALAAILLALLFLSRAIISSTIL